MLTKRLKTAYDGVRFIRMSSNGPSSSNNSNDHLAAQSYAPFISDIMTLDSSPPKKSQVVVCGGGLMGISMLYHLSKLGSDVVLLEQGRLGGPTAWRSSGFLGGVKVSKPEMRILKSSLKLVKSLNEAGHDTGWKQTGSLHLARSKQRLMHFRRMKAIAEARGTECIILSPKQIYEKCPMLNTSDLCGAFWVPNDGVCDPYKVCLTLLQLAQHQGGKIVEDCQVKRVISQREKVVAVETTKGMVECDTFVNTSGAWARFTGHLSDPSVKVPIHPVEHYFLYTCPIEDTEISLPAIRDPDGSIYMREYNGGVLVGYFESNAKPAFENTGLPDTNYQKELEADWDHFHPALKEMIHRAPFLQDAVLNRLYSNADGFSPDNRWILGMVPELTNYFVAAGMRSGGSNASLGAGEMMSQWIVKGTTPMDTYELDVLRFLPLHNNIKFLKDRIREVPGIHYSLDFPFPDFTSARCLRMSPLFNKLKANGAVFGQIMGYERPSYFLNVDETDKADTDVPFLMSKTDTWTKPHWFDYTAQEYQACRETCAILDYSSFAKFDIWSQGNEVVDALQYLCSNDVDVPVGGIIHTGMQNIHGGYENDCSLARLAPNHYMMIAPSIQQTRCGTWMKRNLPSDGSVIISDVTSMYTAICLMGPLSKNVLSELTDTDLSNKGFPFFSYKEIDVGLANGIRVMNLTHTGELGWVLYIPNEYALHVYNNLVRVGKSYGMRHAGYYAMRSLRVEKFYAFWGQDLDSATTPLECGRGFRVKLDKNIDFIGREALELQKSTNSVKRLYVHLTLDDHDPEIDPWAWGGEPIYRNDEFVGVTTTTSYGYTLQTLVCLGFIRHYDEDRNMLPVTAEYVMNGDYEIDINGVRYRAHVSLRSPSLPTKFPELKQRRYLATRL